MYGKSYSNPASWNFLVSQHIWKFLIVPLIAICIWTICILDQRISKNDLVNFFPIWEKYAWGCLCAVKATTSIKTEALSVILFQPRYGKLNQKDHSHEGPQLLPPACCTATPYFLASEVMVCTINTLLASSVWVFILTPSSPLHLYTFLSLLGKRVGGVRAGSRWQGGQQWGEWDQQ